MTLGTLSLIPPPTFIHKGLGKFFGKTLDTNVVYNLSVSIFYLGIHCAFFNKTFYFVVKYLTLILASGYLVYCLLFKTMEISGNISDFIQNSRKSVPLEKLLINEFIFKMIWPRESCSNSEFYVRKGDPSSKILI